MKVDNYSGYNAQQQIGLQSKHVIYHISLPVSCANSASRRGRSLASEPSATTKWSFRGEASANAKRLHCAEFAIKIMQIQNVSGALGRSASGLEITRSGISRARF
ncbi:MAG: hypothetical protein HDT42_07365 [Ruminococcaceae bacterium]|nr:hypothetical protein [Oscillospiraceae bacterium]